MVPGLTVEALVGDLEAMPLGRLHVDVMMGGLDSRRARQTLVSEIAWPLGKPVVDGGVGEGLLGRVQVFVPGETTACLECGWGAADYQRLVEEYPCHPGEVYHAPSTVSPAFSGAVVAGLMAAEAMQFLTGPEQQESREIAFDLTHRRFLPSRLRRASKCRFDHGTVREFLQLARPFSEATVVDLLTTIENRFGSEPVQIEGRHGFVDGANFRAQRFVTTQWLRSRADDTLAMIGLRPEDYPRIRNGSQCVFVNLN
jgi:hypothetical protein